MKAPHLLDFRRTLTIVEPDSNARQIDMPLTLPTRLRHFAESMRSVSYNGSAGQAIGQAMMLSAEAASEIERLENQIGFLVKQRSEAMTEQVCQCEGPIIRCDDKGCRCELCGGLER